MKVFVYGTLKKGFHNHALLENAKFLGWATLEGSHVLLDAGFPVCVPLYTGSSKVIGEVYEVTPAEMKRLDRLEGEGRMYHRVKRKVEEAEGVCNAWVYIGDRKYWKDRANVGSQWANHDCFEYRFNNDR
jgi:gamma-glutamylaminecyclotransferase